MARTKLNTKKKSFGKKGKAKPSTNQKKKFEYYTIGALWEREKGISGVLNVLDQDNEPRESLVALGDTIKRVLEDPDNSDSVRIFVMENTFKNDNKQPDYNLVLGIPEGQFDASDVEFPFAVE